MKILQLISKTSTGGAEKFAIDLSNEFDKCGNNVVFVSLYDIDKECTLEEYLHKSSIKRLSLHKKNGVSFSCFISLFRLIKKEKPDVVHAHGAPITYLFLSAIIYRKCKYFATIHSEAKREAGGVIERSFRKILFKLQLCTPVTISLESQKSFVNFYKMSAPMIPNGCVAFEQPIDESIKVYHKDCDTLFVHVGRLHPVKNQKMLIESFKKIIHDGYKVKLIVIGRNDNEDIYQYLRSNINDKIIYLGEQSECRKYMKISDVFCLSSVMEGMPISIIEAMSVGCVPIVTPVGGCVNLIENGESGFISETLASESYYLALKKYLDLSESRHQQMSNKVRMLFNEKYTIELCAHKYFQLYTLDENKRFI